MNEVEIMKALSTLIEPKLKWNIVSLNLIKKFVFQEGTLHLEIHLVTHNTAEINQFRQQCLEVLQPFGFPVELQIANVHIATRGISGVKEVILVGSGKGGVGKSTIAVNLAKAIANMGKKVGLMDADIYGPSIPMMLGINQQPEVLPDEYLLPVEAHNLQVMSIGLLVPPGKAIAWRGQLASGTIVQFIEKTFWNELDYLVIDLPPGTGDIQLTIAHKIRVKGIVIVATPQHVVLGDVHRALDLYREREIPVLSIVENMSGLICENCGHVNQPFGTLQAEFTSEVPHYMTLPLDTDISRTSDAGIPISVENSEHPISQSFQELATHIVSYSSSETKEKSLMN